MGTDHGLWPVGGGSLDQAESFMDFVSLWERVLNKIEEEKSKDVATKP